MCRWGQSEWLLWMGTKGLERRERGWWTGSRWVAGLQGEGSVCLENQGEHGVNWHHGWEVGWVLLVVLLDTGVNDRDGRGDVF